MKTTKADFADKAKTAEIADVAKSLSAEAIADIIARVSSSGASEKGEGNLEAGWAKLSNGLIVQWGTGPGGGFGVFPGGVYGESNGYSAIFPIPFPNQCKSVQLTTKLSNATLNFGELVRGSDYDYQVVSMSLSGFTYIQRRFGGGSSYFDSARGTQVYFLAIGY